MAPGNTGGFCIDKGVTLCYNILMTKKVFLIIRVTEEEKDKIAKRARRAGKTLTSLLREYLKL
jgi:hypothetical protein